ncbi:MAG: acyltransferase [Actinomycetales bacterium]|nr:acyltransferase [Actinomycetales bacterium]
MRGSLHTQVVAGTHGRDRVTDFVKSAALLLVVIGHSLAWLVRPDGSLDNTLNHAPQLWWLTWALQILPLFFFIAGAGMVRLAGDHTAARYLSRAAGLMEPAVLLFVFAFVASCVLHAVAPASLQRNLGVLMVQLTWFLGGYMLYIALAPVLIRMNRPAGIAVTLTAITGVDWLRLHVSESLGWLNMLLVWAFFTIIGTRKDALRRVRAWLSLVGLAAAAGAAALLIAYGPYSKALITAKGLPGISNLAPPTLVLACAGVAQIFALMLAWPALERWLRNDRVWVPVAIFGSRAMQVYLYHMLVLVAVVSPFIARRSVTQPLSLGWWGQHALVFVVTLSIVMLAAPALRRASRALASAVLVRPWSTGMRQRLTRMSRGPARALAATSGVLLLVQSTTGIGDFLAPRSVVGAQVYPVLTWLLLMLCISLQLLAAKVQTGDAGPVKAD